MSPLKHTYIPMTPIESFAGLSAIFGGPQDQFVLRAGTGRSYIISSSSSSDGSITTNTVNDIYIWDCDTTSQLYCIQAPITSVGTLTAFAWNCASDAWMFATGTHEGQVHIWTVHDCTRL